MFLSRFTNLSVVGERLSPSSSPAHSINICLQTHQSAGDEIRTFIDLDSQEKKSPPEPKIPSSA